VFGALSILLLEMKYGARDKHYDAIGQVIAECSGMHFSLTSAQSFQLILYILACDHFNNRFNLPSFPIHGILCDGTTFEFFSFDGSTSPPTISCGAFHTSNSDRPSMGPSLADYSAGPRIDFICNFWPVCEVLFYILLLASKNGVQVKACHGENKAKPYKNKHRWNEAHLLATQALMHAKDAAAKAADAKAADVTGDDYRDLGSSYG
jgi:hypothetical protein